MLHDVRVQRADDAEVVGDALQMRKELADNQAGLAARAELERRAEQRQRLGFMRAQAKGRDGLAVALLQLRLRIKRVEVRKALGEEQQQQLFGLGGEMHV